MRLNNNCLTPKLALVITQYIEAYNKCHSGGLSPDPLQQHRQVIQGRAHTGADKSYNGSGVKRLKRARLYKLVLRRLAKKGIMKYTTVKISEIRKHPTMRLDAKYWIKRKKNKKASSFKLQAALTMDQGYCRMNLESEKYDNNNI